ncbi:multidrug resistance-associated protein 5 [Tanacetum coccineum]|uniref:Multidrug resistance-associated protein 5 n=1 Tax=Tanacetum coccineum TaxID=301880 RepID=A0ABQ5GZM2_9ASTR
MIPGTDLHQFDVHNDGYFAHLPLNYVDGVIFEMAVPRMPYEQLAEFLDEKCGCYFQGLYYQVPNQDLEMGLVRVSDDRSVSYMFDVENTFGRLNLYVDHLDMNLSEYLSQAITIDMDACVYKKIWPPKKRYCNDFSVNEMVDWAEMEVETEGVKARTNTTEGVEARTSITDKGKDKVSKDATKVVESRRCTVENDSEAEYESDDDSDYQSDKSVEYLSPGEEELIELRNRMKANRQAKGKAKDNQDPGMNEPNAENSMHADNVRGETFEEHDIYMNELLKSLKTPDKDGNFKECLTYYALANGFSLWHERSGEERVVVKCGQRPLRVSAPEKGKQRKQTKYHCASSDALHKCPWRCYARWMTNEKTFQCISLVDEHTCVRNFNFDALVNYKWIAKIFGDKIRANPNIKLCDIADLVMKKYKCKVSLNQRVNAKKYALTEYEKSIGEHYSMLKSYGKAILDSNPGSTVKLGVIVNPDGETYFDSPNQGEILTAIGRDGNNHIYPVAWAVGLIEAVKDVMSNVEHKQCARHIYENFRKQYPGLEFLLKEQQRFWHVIPAGGNLFEVRSGSVGFIVDEGKRTCTCMMWQLLGLPCVHATKSMYFTVLSPKPRKMSGRPKKKRIRAIDEGCSSTRVSKLGRPRKNQSVDDSDDVDVVPRGQVRDEGASGSRGGATGSRGRGSVAMSKGCASGSRGDASFSRGVVGGSRGGFSVSGGASGSRGRGAGSGSKGRGVGGSKRKPVSTTETQKTR